MVMGEFHMIPLKINNYNQMRKVILSLLTIILLLQAANVGAQNYYWVAFTDKNNTEYSLSAPEEYLSPPSIMRRLEQGIAIDSLDLPVNSFYIDSVLKVGATLVHSSKWLNGVTVKTTIDTFKITAEKFPFVKKIQLTKPAQASKSTINKFKEIVGGDIEPIDTSYYGESVYQTGLMNGQFLHNDGYNGKGKQIAVIDAGFYNADHLDAFDSLWANNQILGTKDFVNPNDDFYSTHSHGMSVLSCMGGNVPGHLIGTAREAKYWLLRSEDVYSEYLIEEDNWVAAAEFADSVGVDVINSSLGYFEFDDATTSHNYNDMDGNTTRVTQAANIAFSRGILVVVAAGNEGNKSWHYIIAPADGDNVIAVGATNWAGYAAPFTSFGPASDGDIKPNVVAVGWNTYLQLSNGSLGKASGTSFASPVMAGMAASLWQAAPGTTAADVKEAIEMSSHQYDTPDSILGYGIPDFKMAWLYLVNQSVTTNLTEKRWVVYPNPVRDFLVIQNKNTPTGENIRIGIYSVEGKLIRTWNKPNQNRISLTNIQNLPEGILLMKISSANFSQTVKLNKIR
jgi:hypothetical protein